MYTSQGTLMGGGGGQSVASYGSRAEFEKFMPEVPSSIQNELTMRKLRLGDQIIYSIKPVGSSTTIKMFETQDDKETGLRNISNARLPKNQTLLLSGIYLLAGVAPAAVVGSPTKEEIMATPFSALDSNSNFAALINGEFNLRSNKVQIVPETSNRAFSNQLGMFFPVGYYKLHNPRLIDDDVLIEASLELGTIQNIPPDTFIYIGLSGTITTP